MTTTRKQNFEKNDELGSWHESELPFQNVKHFPKTKITLTKNILPPPGILNLAQKHKEINNHIIIKTRSRTSE